MIQPAAPRRPERAGFRWHSRILGLVALGAVLCLTRGARADGSSAAQVAYERGVDAFRAGDFANACRLLSESYHLEPHPGVLFTWATCELRADRLASAAQHYQDFLNAVAKLPVAERVAQEERRRSAQRERAQILPELPYLTVVVSASVQRSSSVLRDGVPLLPSAQGVEVPVDPGEHSIVFVGSDGARTEQRVVLARREHKTVVLGFANAREAERAVAPVSTHSEPAPMPRGNATSPWVYVTGGIGVAGLLTGTISGVMALRDKHVVDSNCAGAACTARGKDSADAGRTEATVSTIGFGVGLAGLASSIIIYLVDSPGAPTRAQHAQSWSVAVSPTSVGVVGAF